MKNYFWKFFICIVPCLLALWVTVVAVLKYYEGDSGGFKLGVDLVGGTILVYEIDVRKSRAADKNFDANQAVANLADRLKKRIDPNDLYNITIRPAGGEGRIEIILPTGGSYRAQKAEAQWNKLLRALETDLPKGTTLKVGRGEVLKLSNTIQTIQSEDLWRTKLFATTTAWERLQKSALRYWAKIQLDMEDEDARIAKKKSGSNKMREDYFKITPGDLKSFADYVENHLKKDRETKTSRDTIEAWVKRQAWDETMSQARRQWLISAWDDATDYAKGNTVVHGDRVYKAVDTIKKTPPPHAKWELLEVTDKEPFQVDMERIAPDSVNQLTTFVITKGTVIGQGAFALLEPLVGDKLQKVSDNEKDPTADEVRKFIRESYGRPVQEITNDINKKMEKEGLSHDLSVEEVHRIKDLITKVGSLEFRVLANNVDDLAVVGRGEDDGEARLKINRPSAFYQKLIEEAQKNGSPPPAPRESELPDARPKKYQISTANQQESTVSYAWVELGPQERRSLNLDNAAKIDPARNTAWHAAANARNKAIQLPESAGATDKFLLQGALFYSRECKAINLEDKERREKEIEYFVLTREPEYRDKNSDLQTERIDGSFLKKAYGGPGADMRPTVHFEFNVDGGNLFGRLTRKNVSEEDKGIKVRRHLAIILDGMVMSAPTVNSEIRTAGQISGTFTQKEVDSLVNILRAGQLPATLNKEPVSENTIPATLGEATISSGVTAILLSFGAVLAFMVVYYRFAGLVASIALLANLLLTVGFMVAVQATFTLYGLAGIVLTLGMAVDANVLIYERLREERERGASLLQAIRNGYDHALPTIIDTHLSSIFTAIVLYVVGNDNLKGFAISMTVGLVISLFTSLYMTRVMFDYWQEQGWLSQLTMMRLFERPDWDFMSIRYIMFAATLGLSVAGIALFVGRLPAVLNIDFVGGTAYGGKLREAKTMEDLRPLIDEKKQKEVLGGVIVEEVPGSDGRRFHLTFPKGNNTQRMVSFSVVPEGTTKEAREATVKQRASLLEDATITLLFNKTTDETIIAEMNAGKSRNFQMRTTEKEAELVQACADQLFRDSDGKPMLEKVVVRRGTAGQDSVFRFYQTEKQADTKETDGKPSDPTAWVSPSYVKSLLNREFRRSFNVKDDKPLPFILRVEGDGERDTEGRYKTIRIIFEEQSTQRIGDFDKKVEDAFKNAEQALSHPLPDQLSNFDSGVANQTRIRAMAAILASWAAILLYLWFRFGNWTFGLAAVICLIHDLFFTLGAIAICHFLHGGPLGFIGEWLRLDDFKIDLPSVAALLTLVGYSVNDTIVVFDRIREVRGKNPDLTPKMLNDSVNQTLSRTILASLTVWLVVFVLYVAGGPGVHLFAFVMVVGVLVGTYSSIYIAAPLLLMFGEGKHEDTTAVGEKLSPTPASTNA